MINMILAIFFLTITFVTVVIRKVYGYYPLSELRRQSQRGDVFATRLYSAVAFGGSLRALLWTIITFSSASSFVLLARQESIWLSILIVVAVIWLAGSWLPNTKVTKYGARLTGAVTPFIVSLLHYVNPVIGRTSDLAKKRYLDSHTRMFEMEDLMKLIEKQQLQHDSRFTPEELEIAKRALSFGGTKVSEIMTKSKDMRTVLSNETIGPILIDELHKSGQPVVFVSEKPKGQLIGAVELKDLTIESKGVIADVMQDTIYFVHQKDTLAVVLHALNLTNRSLLVVINDEKDYVGVVTLKNLLEQLLGHIPGETFDQYDNPAAVIDRHLHPEPEQKLRDEDVDAVIEL
jgi:CBS domain containing-hemolysin-like protein